MANASQKDKLYMQLNASELSAIIMKGSPHSNDRDAGFCSGSSEGGDDCSIDHLRMEPSSPTDASEDSVEVKVMPISLVRNKRKSCEPSKVVCEREELLLAAAAANQRHQQSCGPLKKRIRYTSNSADSAVILTPPIACSSSTSTSAAPSPPLALWDPSQVLPHELMPNPAQVFIRHPGVTTLHRLPVQEEPLALVSKKSTTSSSSSGNNTEENRKNINKTCKKSVTPKKRLSATVAATTAKRVEEEGETLPKKARLEVPLPSITSETTQALSLPTADTALNPNRITQQEGTSSASSSAASCTSTPSSSMANKSQQRNYKNMTRERRIEANARERSRVHTISAAYETLRRAVPSYSSNQKLSKLSVLRVACSYILTLSRMAGYDYSEDGSEPSIDSCFDAVTATIQTEGKIRKKKED